MIRGPANTVKHARSRGFTLIELMVVLFILGVIGAMAPLAWKTVMPGVTLRSEASQMVDLLRQLRGEALSKNKSAVFELNVNDKHYRAGLLGIEHDLPDDIEIRFISARQELSNGAGGIRFYPDGSSSGGEFTFSNERGHKVTIRVDWLTGRVILAE